VSGRGRGWRSGEGGTPWTCPICRKVVRIMPSKVATRKTCSSACRNARVEWRCPIDPCRNVLTLRPGEARRRKACSLACRNRAKWSGKNAETNRKRRVMFVHGYTEAQAVAYLKGWGDGRSTAMQTYLRGKRLDQRGVGSEQWERQQRIA
jgi:hypothetical protein